MGLRGAVHQQRPALRAVRVADQLGHPVVDLGPQRAAGDTVRPGLHPVILPRRPPRASRGIGRNVPDTPV